MTFNREMQTFLKVLRKNRHRKEAAQQHYFFLRSGRSLERFISLREYCALHVIFIKRSFTQVEDRA